MRTEGARKTKLPYIHVGPPEPCEGAQTLWRALFRQESTPGLRVLCHSCVAGVTEAVELTEVLSVARPGDDEAVGQEAVAEQFFSLICGACQGRVAAKKWSEHIAPDAMAIVDARNAASQTKTTRAQSRSRERRLVLRTESTWGC